MADPLRNSGLSEIEDHWKPVLVTEIFLVSAEWRENRFSEEVYCRAVSATCSGDFVAV
jgi:hypothetical protein